NGFAGSFAESQATITWSASNELGFTFVADPGSFATSVPEAGPIALLGHERNGTFFPAGSSGPERTGLGGGGRHPATSSPTSRAPCADAGGRRPAAASGPRRSAGGRGTSAAPRRGGRPDAGPDSWRNREPGRGAGPGGGRRPAGHGHGLRLVAGGGRSPLGTR